MVKPIWLALSTLLVSACGGSSDSVNNSNLPDAAAFHLNAAHTGSTTFPSAPKFPNSSTWQVTLDGAVSYPVIADGLTFLVISGNGKGGSGSRLLALNAASGTAVWGPILLSGNTSRAGHAYDAHKVYVASKGGAVQAFAALTGIEVWRVQLPANYSVSAPPTAIDGVVYVGAAGNAGAVFALDGKDGRVLWKQSLEDLNAGEQSAPTISADGVFVSYTCQSVKMSRANGTLAWNLFTACSVPEGYTAVFANDHLYARRGTYPPGAVLRNDSGAFVGEFPGDGDFEPARIPAITPSAAFLLATGKLGRWDTKMQTLAWSFVGDGQLVSAPIVINQIVVVGSKSGKVYALDSDSGSQIWTGVAGGPIEAADESTLSKPLVSMAAGAGHLVVPAGNTVTAWRLVP